MHDAPDPASLAIRVHPDPILRVKARDVEPMPPSDEVRAIAARMIELMHEAEGIGLAATQVGLPWRLFVADVPPPPPDEAADGPTDKDWAGDADATPTDDEPPATATAGPTVYLNPTIDRYVDAPTPFEEGCLSLPDLRGDVLRPPTVVVTAYDLAGRPFTTRAAGLLARCLQHEIDHLDGVLIFDRMTPLARRKVKTQLRKLEASA